MPKSIVLFLFLLWPLLSAGQSSVAKLKFEQAEQSFTEGLYVLANNKLDEVEKILGSSNPRILHLRILSEYEIVKGNLDENLPLLEKLRGHVAFYLKNYSQNGLEKFYEEVQHVNQRISAFSQNKEEIQSRQRATEANEKKRRVDGMGLQESSLNYILSTAQKFRFNKGMPMMKFAEQSAELAKLFNSVGVPSGALTYYTASYKKNNPYQPGPYSARVDEEKNVVYYSEVLFSEPGNKKAATNYFMKMKSEVEQHVDPAYVTTENDGNKIIVNAFGSDTALEITQILTQNVSAVTITFK